MNILFGKRKSSKLETKPTQTLSPEFAQEMLYLEECLNLNCSLSTVTRLIELYTKAIEFYEAEKNLKHIHYQERMQSLLSRTNVIQLFKNPSVSRSQSKVFTNNSFVSPKSKPSLIINTDLAVERNCEKVIKAHTLESSTVSRKLQENLKNQYDRLDQRLFFRKQSTPKVVIKTQRFEEMNQCDISAGEAKVNPIEEFEKDVERIIEKYVEEKIKIKEKIEKDYQEYFI